MFSGYAPLSVRLVELFEKPQGWGTFEEVSGCEGVWCNDIILTAPTGYQGTTRPTSIRPVSTSLKSSGKETYVCNCLSYDNYDLPLILSFFIASRASHGGPPPHSACVLPGRLFVRRDLCSQVPLANGGRWVPLMWRIVSL